jgi:hypothetical protein
MMPLLLDVDYLDEHLSIFLRHTCGGIVFLSGVQGAGGKNEIHTWSQGGEQQVLPVRSLQMCR